MRTKSYSIVTGVNIFSKCNRILYCHPCLLLVIMLLCICNGPVSGFYAPDLDIQHPLASPSIHNSFKLTSPKEDYIRQSAKTLQDLSKSGCVDSNKIEHIILEEGSVFRHRLFSGKSCVCFPNGDRIYFLVHSAHQNESIGDLTIAVDQNGRVYLNEGHVCGDVVHFYSNMEISHESADHFMQTMKSDTDDKPFYLNN